MITDILNIEIADSPDQAQSYDKDWQLLKVTKAIVVCKGTVNGNPTVDLQLQDEKGNKYLIMATGGIIESLGQVVVAKRKQTNMN